MLNFTLIYSDFDELVITYFVSSVLCIYLLKKAYTKVKNITQNREIEIINVEAQNYNLGFNDEFSYNKPVNLITRLIIIFLASLFAIIPLDDLILTLKVQEYFTFSCFPFLG